MSLSLRLLAQPPVCLQAPELQGAAVGAELVPINASRAQGYRELPRRPVYIAEKGAAPLLCPAAKSATLTDQASDTLYTGLEQS